MYGVEAPILKLQTATSVKDKVAQYWINILLEKARQMKASDSVAEDLQKWLDEQPGDKVNPLLDIAGLDPNRDTPVELLHTILLGIINIKWANWQAFQDPGASHGFPHAWACSPELFRLVKAVSALGSVLWVHEIDNVKEYTEHLTILIGNVLDVLGDHDPAKILLKVPSRDIAHKFASMDRLKHILSGGFWKQGNEWVQAAPNVRDVLQTMPIIQCHLGWVLLKKVINAQSGDTYSQGTWIFARNYENVFIIGCVLELLTPVGDAPDVPMGLVTLENFLVSEELHPDYDMPVIGGQQNQISELSRSSQIPSFSIFLFSMIIDWPIERQETSQTAPLIAHADDDHFCINMAAIHHQHYLPDDEASTKTGETESHFGGKGAKKGLVEEIGAEDDVVRIQRRMTLQLYHKNARG
ncbi:hypothetical protein B0H13DRAFT_1900035 [Mycena leptocephala]|nr:hypothetical protein B0H13DRAFT_1900035 [Mycena leptocephala]